MENKQEVVRDSAVIRKGKRGAKIGGEGGLPVNGRGEGSGETGWRGGEGEVRGTVKRNGAGDGGGGEKTRRPVQGWRSDGDPRAPPCAAHRCRCARRCFRSCGTRCLAARLRVPAGAGAQAARAGPCCRCEQSARCASATASSTRPARAGMGAARTAAPSASWTTRGRLAGPGH